MAPNLLTIVHVSLIRLRPRQLPPEFLDESENGAAKISLRFRVEFQRIFVFARESKFSERRGFAIDGRDCFVIRFRSVEFPDTLRVAIVRAIRLRSQGRIRGCFLY